MTLTRLGALLSASAAEIIPRRGVCTTLPTYAVPLSLEKFRSRNKLQEACVQVIGFVGSSGCAASKKVEVTP